MLSALLSDETVKKDFGYLGTVLVMLRRSLLVPRYGVLTVGIIFLF